MKKITAWFLVWIGYTSAIEKMGSDKVGVENVKTIYVATAVVMFILVFIVILLPAVVGFARQ